MFAPLVANDRRPIYVQLADQVRHAIDTGLVQPDARLPGVRDVAARLGINANTILKAYHELAHEGVVELRHGVGIFALPPGQRVPSLADRRQAVTLMADTVDQLRAAGIGDARILRMCSEALRPAPEAERHQA